MDGTVVSLGGELEPGEPSGVAIIRKLLRQVHSFPSPCFIDCPPGSACAVTESIKGADYCVLVAEPTVFGLHNLAMVYELTRLFGLPCGVVVNKAEEDDERAERFCAEKGIPVLARIPYDKDIGTLASEGFVLVRENETHRAMFRALLKRIFEEADREAATDSQR
jgi:MinD superfamily P-loop ATPase